MLKKYLLLTKPGIIMGNAITAAGGFALACHGRCDWRLLFITLAGLSLIVGAACVFNNYIDKEADKKMERTKKRPLPSKDIDPKSALIFAVLLGFFGTLILALWTSPLALLTALGGMAIYVGVYSFWKYRSSTATLVGSVAGAAPPVVGYVAASSQLDKGALLIFLIVALWQMPHFFAIAVFRFSDYAAAGIPVLPIRRGMQVTKIHMLCYIVAFVCAALCLPFFGFTGAVYAVVISLLGLGWLALCVIGFKKKDDIRWARHMFRFSLVVIMLLCFMIGLDGRR